MQHLSLLDLDPGSDRIRSALVFVHETCPSRCRSSGWPKSWAHGRETLETIALAVGSADAEWMRQSFI
jgi:hypothetical protein